MMPVHCYGMQCISRRTFQGNKEKEDELKKLKGEMEILQGAAADGIEAAGKVKTLEAEVKKLTAENTTLGENFNSERVCTHSSFYNPFMPEALNFSNAEATFV